MVIFNNTYLTKLHGYSISLCFNDPKIPIFTRGKVKDIHHQYYMYVLGTSKIEATGFGFSTYNNEYYSIKYKIDNKGSLYFSDLYRIEFLEQMTEGRTYTSTQINPLTSSPIAYYKSRSSDKYCSKTGKLLQKNFSINDGKNQEIWDTLENINFPYIDNIIFYGFKPYGTTIEFVVPGISSFYKERHPLKIGKQKNY